MAELQWAIADADLRRVIEEIHRDKGYSAEDARDLVIIEWLGHGDVGPFIEANNAGHICGPLVQNLIAIMLLDGRLKIGRPQGGQTKPGSVWQDIIVTQVYERERARLDNYDEAVRATGDLLGMSEGAVKDCVRKSRSFKSRIRLA